MLCHEGSSSSSTLLQTAYNSVVCHNLFRHTLTWVPDKLVGTEATTKAAATRTSSQNINSRYCYYFVIISTFLIWQGCGSSLRKTLVGAFNLGEKMKIYPKVLTFFKKPEIWLCHVVVFLTTAKKRTKLKNARAGRANLLLLLTKHANLWRSRCRRRCLCLSSLFLGREERILFN